ncbi:hypothetical protein Trydic_g15537 [Trypoxylus dichotomus]
MTTNSKLPESITEPLSLCDEDTDYDTDFSHLSFRSEKLATDISKNNLDKRRMKPVKATIKNVTFSPRTNVDEEDIAASRQKLEFNLTNVQIEESLSTEFHKNLQQRFDKVENALDALSQYVDAVCLEMKACYRLCQQLNSLINEKSFKVNENMGKLTTKICKDTDLSFQYQIKEKIYMIVQDKEELNNLLAEYNNRRTDFKVASENFKILLDTANLNIKQMNKLQKQYDKILANYQHSRYMLDKYIPGEISQRISVLLNCLSEFADDLERMASERTDMSQMFQHLQPNIKISSDNLDDLARKNHKTDNADFM